MQQDFGGIVSVELTFGAMEHRFYPDFGRRLFSRCLLLFAAAMACLGVGMYGETHPRSEALRICGHIAFLAFAVAIPFYVWYRSRKSRCRGCGAWLHSNPKRDQEATLKFVCTSCAVEWDTQGVVAW
jgi:hypothetical protein